MKNEEYFHEIDACIDAIETCIEKTKEMAVGVIGENLISLDLCFCGLMDRSIRIAQGFICMHFAPPSGHWCVCQRTLGGADGHLLFNRFPIYHNVVVFSNSLEN